MALCLCLAIVSSTAFSNAENSEIPAPQCPSGKIVVSPGQKSVCAKEIQAYTFLDSAMSILENEQWINETNISKARYTNYDLENSLGSLKGAKEIVEAKLIECRKKHPCEF